MCTIQLYGMQSNRYVIYMNPAKMARLKVLSMTNFSGWVNREADLVLEAVDKACRERCNPQEREKCWKSFGTCMDADAAAERIQVR